MRFLDIDLDFFLNRNAYYSGDNALRLGDDYKPWCHARVRRFLEARCGLTLGRPVPGRVIESHDLVVGFWRDLIVSGNLKVPFDVVHIDAHPDLSVRGGLHLVSNRLYVEPAENSETFEEDYIHSGNYLTFAIARGWIASLIWIPLDRSLANPRHRRGDLRLLETRVKGTRGISFKIVSWHNYKTCRPFDYITLSRSPPFTPNNSDALVPVFEDYMRII
jgi:hypothetical protein